MKAKEELTRAIIQVLDKDDSGTELEPVTLQFNPSELSFTRQASWVAMKEGDSKGMPMFEGSQADELKFKILFDQTVVGEIELADASGFLSMISKAAMTAASRLSAPMSFTAETNDNSVTDQLKAIYALASPAFLVDPNAADKKKAPRRPPVLLFSWGEEFTFLGTITNLDAEILVMDAAGKPKRAVVDVQMWGQVLGEGDTTAKFFELRYVEDATQDLLDKITGTSGGTG